MDTKNLSPSKARRAALRFRYVVFGALVLVLALVGIVVVLVNGGGGSVSAGGLSNPRADIERPAPGPSIGGGKKAFGGMHGAKRVGASRGRGRIHAGLSDDDGEDMDDLPPEDRRLLSAIEEGRDDDSLEKVLKVLPEAAASTNAEIRSELVDALDSFGVQAMNHLLPFLADPDDDVRQSAIDSWTSTLGEVDDEKMKAKLITAVKKMGIINFGSMNVDHVYSMQHFVQPGETLQSGAYNIYCGGKGLNQSVAAAREQYEFLTGDEYTTVEDADKWLTENYEPPSQGSAANGN